MPESEISKIKKPGAGQIKFIPYYQLGDHESVIVDGKPHPRTRLTLSHWKNSGTPGALLRDTSAQIVLDYLENNSIPSDLEYVSNDHFDQDGLVGIFAILNPEYALSIKPLLIDIAEAGDFAKFQDRKAARITFTIASLVNQISNSDQNRGKAYPALCGVLYQELLSKLREIIEDTNSYRELWKDEDEFLRRSEEGIEQGKVKITEDGKNKIALIDVAVGLPGQPYHWAVSNKQGPVHDMAIHNKTRHTQLLYRQGKKYWFKYRYEGWVTFQSYPVPLRVDLHPLCSKLNSIEENTIKWSFTGAEDIVPVLSGEGESSIAFSDFQELLNRALRTSAVAWDPFSEK